MGKFQEALALDLILYARQLAWLDAVISDGGENENQSRVNRRERLIDDGVDILMPDCDDLYLIELLYEIGPVETVGMGPVAISHLQLRAYQDNLGISLDPWKVKTLRRLSVAYCHQLGASSEWNCPAPFTSDDVEQHNRDRVEAQFRTLLSNFSVKSGN